MFEGSHLSLKQIFELSYYWTRGNWAYEENSFQTREWHDEKLSTVTFCDWAQYFRDVCAEYFVAYPIRIGGHRVIVEIDETFLARRKYQRGEVRGNHGQWLFGGVVRGDPSQCFMVPVEKRDAATLLPIIEKYMLPGTIIISDLWKAEETSGSSALVALITKVSGKKDTGRRRKKNMRYYDNYTWDCTLVK